MPDPAVTARSDVPLPAAASPEAGWRAARNAAVVTADTGFALVSIKGADAEAFLHGQLSNDVKALAPGRGHWTSYNSPKGRMLATMFLLRRAPDAFTAIVAADVAEPLKKRLSMFVLRSKAVLTASSHRLFGIGGPRASDAVAAALGVACPAGAAVHVGVVDLAGLPDGRCIAAVPPDAAGATFASLAAGAEPVGADVWAWLGVRAGVPVVTAATQDLFVPQTANWDAIGGVDFRKGCYPGQEIVARTQYLGRLKERLFAYATGAAAPAPGTRLFGAPFGDQTAGVVVNSAPAPEGGSVFLAVAQTSAADAGPLAIGTPGGPRAHRQPLPYALPEPLAPRGRLPK